MTVVRNSSAVPPITCLFLDLGGVLLTDGWGRESRKRAAAHFRLNSPDIEERHHRTWDTYQEGKLSLDEYLNLVVFYQKRKFTRSQFRRCMFAETKPYPQMIDLVMQLKIQHGLKIAVVSNEGREINTYRIRKFGLDRFVDCFVTSCFVHLLKPDADIYRLASDITQAAPRETIYIENTPLFVEVAEGLGIRGILHTDYTSTRNKLNALGLLT